MSSVESRLPIPTIAHLPQLGVVVDGISIVEQQLALLRARADVLASCGDANTEIDSLRRLVTHALDALASLRECAIEGAFAGDSLGGRAAELRARANVLVGQLQVLSDASCAAAAPLWPTGRFRSMRDVVACVVAGLARVDLTSHESAFDAAERAFYAIGMDADLACFLAAGASMAMPRLRAACRVIAALLGVALAPATSMTCTPTVAASAVRSRTR